MNRSIEGSGNRIAYLVVALAPLCWAGNIVLARGVVDIISPAALSFWRWALAFMLLLPFTWKRAKRDWPTAIRSWKMLTALSLLGLSLFSILLYTAVHTTTAINGALIQTAMPAVIVLLSLVLYREKCSRAQLLGVGLSICGAALVVLRGRLSTILGLSLVEGDLLMMLAVVIYALYSSLLRLGPEIHPLSFLLYTFGIGAAGLCPLYFREIAVSGAIGLSRGGILSVLYVAVFPSIVGYFCWIYGVRRIGANRTGLFINLIPVFASILAILFLDESLKLFHLIGMILIFAGMVLFNRRGG